MAIVMAGGFVGFWTALVAWLLLDMGLVVALGLWVGAGPLSATLALALSARPGDGPGDAPACGSRPA